MKMLLPKQVPSGSVLKLQNLRANREFVINVVALFSGIVVVAFLPYLQIGIIYNYLWSRFNVHVNRSTCSCSCWDTTFKGIYEAGVSPYKHVYINATPNSFKMWCITVVASCLLCESIRTIVHLYCTKRIRLNFCMLFLLNIYPLYYSWWAFFNYWNDDFYRQWYHQLLFTITEVASSTMSLHLTSADSSIQPWKLLIIFDIGLSHVLIALLDQFASNVLRGQGELHQILRDIGFMIPDIIHLYVPLKEFVILGKKCLTPPLFLISNKAFITSVSFVISMLVLSRSI